jgi:peptide/nickel transport system ATP-binding protein
MDSTLLEIAGLTAELETERGRVRVLEGVSLRIEAGQTLCVVGESGCGKSLTALSILRLLPNPPLRISSGQIRYQSRDLLQLPMDEMRSIRGNRVSMIFQEPMSSLNPVYPIGEQIAEVVRLHQGKTRQQARVRALEMLEQVGIPGAERVDHYPHQLSGGMRQRVMIAMALACEPDLLIADEPTTALDVTIQAQILELIRSLRTARRMAVLLITHDLGLVAEHADVVAVMYAGKVVETAPVSELFARPQHPYTRGLLKSIPALGKELGRSPDGRRQRLPTIPGTVPAPWAWPSGCRFRDRCDRATEICAGTHPSLETRGPAHAAACYHPGEAA